MISPIINRNLQSLSEASISHGPIACLISGHRRGHRCNVPSCNGDFSISVENTIFQLIIDDFSSCLFVFQPNQVMGLTESKSPDININS